MIRRIKNIAVISSLVGTSLLTPSCNDWLEITPPDKVSSGIVYTNYENAAAILNGIYDVMTYVSGTPISPGYMLVSQSIGIHNFLITGDLMAQDVMPKTYISDQWQGTDYNYSSRLLDKTRPDFFWKYCYGHINVVNDLLANLDKIKCTAVERKQIEGEARFIRAYMYWLLATWFQQSFLKNPDAAGVPIYLTPTVIPQERAKLSEVYNTAIIPDLEWALDNLPEIRHNLSKYYPGNDVVQGLLSRVYLEMGNYEAAGRLAGELVDVYPLMEKADYMEGITNVFKDEVIWGLPTNKKNTSGNYTMQTVWNHKRPYGRWSQNYVFINDKFRDLFSDTDIRKELIVDNPGTDNLTTYPERRYVTKKISDGVDETKLPDVVLMRGSEMVLIQAECEARLKREDNARTILFKLQQKRDPMAVKTTAAGNELIDQIWIERRKELYGEGFALSDIKRLGKGVKREGNHTFKVDLPAYAPEFVLQIPLKEIQINPLEQNP